MPFPKIAAYLKEAQHSQKAFLYQILKLNILVPANPIGQGTFDIAMSPLMDGRIVGGVETTIDKAPYQVSLQLNGRHFCGGSIIGANWVLTAGHCVSNGAIPITVRAGSTDVNGGSVHSVQQVIRHKDYGSNSQGIPLNDIALLRVSKPFKFDRTRRAIALYAGNSESLVNKYGMITGWGRTKVGGLPTNLRKVDVPLISKQRCSNAYHSVGGIPVGQLCAGFMAGGKDSCQGDSGGPFNVNGQLVGIVSWGLGCAEPNYPGVYTDVSYYRQWIKQNSGV